MMKSSAMTVQLCFLQQVGPLHNTLHRLSLLTCLLCDVLCFLLGFSLDFRRQLFCHIHCLFTESDSLIRIAAIRRHQSEHLDLVLRQRLFQSSMQCTLPFH